EDFAIHLHNKINSSKSFDFKNLGTFYQNQEQNLLFLPFQGLNFLESSFGLEPLKIKLLTVIPSGIMIQSVVEPTHTNSNPEKTVVLINRPKNSLFPRLMKYAAVTTLLFLSVFTLVYLSGKYGKKPLANQNESDQNASIIITDTNFNQEVQHDEKNLVFPEYTSERQQLVEIKNKLSDLSNKGQSSHQSFKVITGYYKTENEVNLNFKKLSQRFEHPEIKVNLDGNYYILIETFFKHTTAEDFSVMLAEMGFKDAKVEPENI
ncbi:MAG: hypothetical protein ACKVQV_12585, partial [Bacteroidia bacterium]